jgi:acyl carrier protein
MAEPALQTDPQTDLRVLIGEIMSIDPEQLDDESGPLTVPAWTSLKHLQLIVAVEKSFDVSLSRKDITGMRTVGAVRAALRDKGVQA